MPNMDVVILVALTEELEAFCKYGFYQLGSKKSLGPFKFYEFSFFDKMNTRRNGTLVLVNDMGSRIRDAAMAACSEFRPDLVLNIGISGRLSNDAKIGDIVIASQINLYAERGAAVPEGEGYVLQPGGSAIPIERELRNAISEPQFLSDVAFPTFDAFCRQTKIEISTEGEHQYRAWIDDEEVAYVPTAVVGPFAAGPLVGKAEGFKHFLKGIDKNVLAIDMESGYVGDAIENMNRKNRPNFLAVRAVSDPGDHRKKDFDAIGNGAFRKWAMNNIVQIIQHFLEKEAEFPEKPISDVAKIERLPRNSPPNGEKVQHHYAESYPGQKVNTRADIDAKNNRFSNLRRSVDGEHHSITYQEFLEELLSAADGAKYLVEGAGGCGKSSMLRFAEDEINNMADQHYAIYVNSRLVFDVLPNQQADIAAREYFKNILSINAKKGAKLVVLLDELFGHPREEMVVTALLDVLASIKGKAVLAFGFDHYETSKSNRGSHDGLYLYRMRYDAEFRLKNTNVFEPKKTIPIIEGILQTTDPIIIGTTAKNILDEVKRLGFPYLNTFVVSLVLENHGKRLFEESRSSTEFILHAMRDELKLRLDGSSMQVKFDDICVEALRVHIPELSRKGVSQKREWLREYYDENFAQFPKLVQTSLIANAVAKLMAYPPSGSQQLFESLEIDPQDFYSIVFGCDVTSSIKDLLHNEELEDRLLRSAISICDKVEGPSLSFALYLAGRAVSANGKAIAKEIFRLTNFLREKDPADMSMKDVRSISSVSREDKFLRLATRTHFISAAYAGEADITSEYIRRVLNDPIEESLNRTFHLEYYGDHPTKSFGSASISVRLELDDSSEGWKRTRGVLTQRITSAIANAEFSQVHRIHILTYFCIIKNKHEAGTLSKEEISDAKDIVNKLKPFTVELGKQLTGFLQVLDYVLQFDRFDIVDIIKKLYSIKITQRFGWVSRNFGPKGESLETVGSHVLGALLLADILLPDFYPHMKAHEVQKVKDILLTHDIGEAFVGDFHPNNQEKREEEKRAIALIDSMRVYGDFSNLRSFGSRFEEYSDGMTFEAKLAMGFDKLDAIVQAMIYKHKFNNIEEFDNFVSENLGRISDVKIRKFAQRVLSRAGIH